MTDTLTTRSPLDSIRIASPCTADWSAMQGNDRTRFCRQCKLNVHDLSTMTSAEALDLLAAAGKGRLCVRFHRRADGTVLTQDCPKGLRKRLRWAWARTAALFSVLLSGFGCARKDGEGGAQGTQATPAQGSPAPVLMGEAHVPVREEMGDVVLPPAKPPAGPVEMGIVAPEPRRER
jgi:hypothetical protein